MAATKERVLITGGLGYVGGRVVSRLLASPDRFDVCIATHRPLDQAPDWAASLNLVQADVSDSESLEAALEGTETVIHLAAVNEIVSANHPGLALRVNGEGTFRLLQACKAASVQRFMYFSTFHVYGPSAPQTIIEDTPTRPVHPYAFTHRLAEDYVNWFRHTGDLETVVLRLSNGYGYPMDASVDRWSLVFNDLCYQAVANGEIVLRSPGTQHRDFIALSDAASAVEHLLELASGGWDDGLFNLGGECSLSILQVAQKVAEEFSRTYSREIRVSAAEPDGLVSDKPVFFSIDKLKATGFQPGGEMAGELNGTFVVCEQKLNLQGKNS